MKNLVLCTTASVFALYASPVVAQVAAESTTPSAGQGAPAGADNDALDGDIVVTATRESTLLSKTPIALTAITGEGLRDTGVTDPRALNNVVPNLFIAQTGQVAIRGVTSTDTTEKGDPSAAFLLDGIYIARPGDILGSFYDVERVEVLRGPQGTLYGRNTTAGVINVISARPVNEFAASLDVEYGNMDNRNVTAMVNVPLGSSVAVRAAVNYDRQDNFTIAGVPMTAKLDPFRDALSGRLSLGGELGGLKFVIRGDYAEYKGSTVSGVRLSNFFGPLTATVDPLYIANNSDRQRTLDFPLNFPAARDSRAFGVMGEISYDFGPTEITYLGSYRETRRRELNSIVIFGVIPSSSGFNGNGSQQSHELRAAFGRGNRLHGQVGAYYFREQSTNLNYFGPGVAGVVAGSIAPLAPFAGFATLYAFPSNPTVARSVAGFGQLTYDITPDLHLTGGIRYTTDDKSRIGTSTLTFGIPAIGVVTLGVNDASRSFSKTTWRVGLDYDAPGLGLIYGSVSTGYKAGGFNDGCETGTSAGCSLSATALYYQPETLTAYEAGFKFRFGSAFRINGSAFHYDYSELQLSQIAGTPPVTLTRNAASAKVDGFELEATIIPGPNSRFDLSFAYTDARYTNFTPAPATLPTFSFNGRALDRAPKYAAGASYTHTFPLGNGSRIEAVARTRLSSAYFLQDLNNLSQFRQPSFTKTDAAITYRAPGGAWYVQGFVQNIEDEITLSGAASGIGASALIEEPRTYGVRAGLRF